MDDQRIHGHASFGLIVQLTRFGLATLGALAGLEVRGLIDWTKQYGFPEYSVIILFVVLGTAIGFILGGIIGRELQRGFVQIEEHLHRLSISDLILGVSGLLIGLVLALIVSSPVRLIEPPSVALTGQIGLYVVLGYAGVRVALAKRRDFARLFPSTVEAAADPAVQAKLLDTSAIIDGRFAELIRIGVIEGPVRVPGFVVSELQTLSDSADDTRRARGRRGLDLLATLRTGEHPVETIDLDYPEIADVDGKLLQLAGSASAVLVTVDYNLSQVARVRGVAVLNLTDVAAALRPNRLPGEALRIHVIKEGKESDQGIGYLEDGTMVVVQNGSGSIGSEVDAVVTSVLQTSGGRMIFARPAVHA